VVIAIAKHACGQLHLSRSVLLPSILTIPVIFSYSTFEMRSCGSLQAIKKNKTEANKYHEIELSKYMLKELLPYLRRLDEEQMAEREIEAKRQGIISSKSLAYCNAFRLIFFFSLINVSCFCHASWFCFYILELIISSFFLLCFGLLT
jgi:hypothetical protein